jgi:hypothetical protein
MVNELESLKIGNETDKSVAAVHQEAYTEMIKDRGIESAVISYRPFKFGIVEEESAGQVYRKFFYNKEGRVIKKLGFHANGGIESKEESFFDKTDKWKILQTNIMTDEEVFTEHYEYSDVNGKQKLKQHSFFNARWPRPKEEKYEYDSQGRINKKTSYGLLGEPELVTHYLYDTAKDTKVTYRYVTLPNEELVMTLLYVYDDKKQKQTALYSFLLRPDEIAVLRAGTKNWVAESVSRSVWEYDAHGNNTGFYRDEKFSRALDMLMNPAETVLPETSRILTEKSSSDYEKINNRYYLVRTTEWLTRMNEPLKAVKSYQYFDGDGGLIFPVPK